MTRCVRIGAGDNQRCPVHDYTGPWDPANASCPKAGAGAGTTAPRAKPAPEPESAPSPEPRRITATGNGSVITRDNVAPRRPGRPRKR